MGQRRSPPPRGIQGRVIEFPVLLLPEGTFKKKDKGRAACRPLIIMYFRVKRLLLPVPATNVLSAFEARNFERNGLGLP